MPNNSQGPSGSGLATSLVNDFRAIMSSLESQRAGTPAADSAEPPAAADGTPAAATPAAEVPPGQDRNTPIPTRFARPPGSPPQREPLPDRPAPMPYAEVRGMITALGDVRDMLSNRRLPAALSESEASAELAASAPSEVAAESASQSRRRAFGTVSKAEETAARRRRAASKDVITWQRLGLLAICIGVAGGGAMALQSVVAREEATVAPDVIGNAAIASVAPSAALPFVAAPPAPVAAPPTQVAALKTAPIRPPLRNTEPMLDASATDDMDSVNAATATAFAASEAISSPIIAPKPVPPPKPTAMPAAAPKRVAAAEAASAKESAAAKEAAAKEEADPDEADGASASGADPVGPATIRSSVTMRAAPRNGSAAVLNLQAGQKVELVACKGWCEIIADGKRGFIYKRFVEAGAAKQAEAAQ